MAEGGSRSEPWTNLPLPPGWEAKYDVAQKRYFFVDHMKKLTTWEDPRIKMWQQQKAQAAQLLVGGAASLNRNSRAASPSRPQGDLSPSQRSTAVPALQTSTASHHGERSRDSTPYRDQQRGSTPSRQTNVQTSTASRLGDRLGDSTPQRGSSPSRQTAQSGGQTNNKAESALSVRAVVAVQDKNKLRDKLHAEFPSCSLPVVDMAMESCSFDEVKSRQLLKNLASTNTAPHSASSRSPTVASTATVASPSVTSSMVSSSMSTSVTSPVAATSSTPAKTTVSSAGISSPKVPQVDSKKKTGGVTVTVPSPLTSANGHSASKQQSVVSQLTNRRSAAKVLQPSAASQRATDHTIMTSAGIIHGNGNHVSVQQSLAKGPNASLANGPNKSLLLTEYVNETGPCAAFNVGPERANRNGPCEDYHVGANPTLVLGPQAAVHCGGSV